MVIPRIDARTDEGRRQLAGLARRLSLEVGPVGGAAVDVRGPATGPAAAVAEIIADVRARGDEAVLDCIRRFDGIDLPPARMRAEQADLDAAHAAVDPGFLAAVRRIAADIRRYQQHILYHAPADLVRDGLRTGIRVRPLRRVGVYVPGGAGSYPSTVLMTVVPAQVAGVTEICLCSPPVRPAGASRPEEAGEIRREVLAVARELGVREVYRIGGVQAIAAMAFGTPTVRPVDKIVGPGNLYVTLAKKQVYGQVDIDLPAGPSEVLVIADDTADAGWAAADMLAQAEHDPGCAVLVTASEATAGRVCAALAAQLPARARRAAIERALSQYGAVVLVGSADEAVAVANRLAPEHLSVQTADAAALAERCVNAGAVFVGRCSPVAFGDYTAGPSHVLPTGGTARFASGLTANAFLKSSSVVEYDPAGCAAAAVDALTMARAEGFEAHAASVEARGRP
jgi:histidinol dehydrogenase